MREEYEKSNASAVLTISQSSLLLGRTPLRPLRLRDIRLLSSLLGTTKNY